MSQLSEIIHIYTRYPTRFAVIPYVRTPGSMPGGGATVQNLGHLEMCCLHSVFSSLSPCLNKYL